LTGLAALVLAAGEGRRLRPLTELRPKPLCPVANVALVDLALDRLAPLLRIDPETVAVNGHHLAGQLAEHLGTRVRFADERERLLGTAGAVGALLPWIAGRDLLISNGDVYLADDFHLDSFLAGWPGDVPRLLVVDDPVRADFAGRWRFAGMSLLPFSIARDLGDQPSGLYRQVWSRHRLDLVATSATYFDCGTPRDYLEANLHASGGDSVVAPSAEVHGELERCVVWPAARVRSGELLREAVRARGRDGSDVTLQVR
jgi:MurNAc alpha-1-phosphate uridylyltransferase